MSNLEFWRNNWSPFKESMALSKALDKVFEEWPNTRMATDMTKYNFNPSCQVTEDKSAYYLKVDLPGVSKEDIKIDLHDNRLTISGERREEKNTDDKEHKTHFSEMFYGSFSRSMTFPMAVDAEKTEAKFDSGVLNLIINKKMTANSRQIAVK
jgi:HSP20 family protein